MATSASGPWTLVSSSVNRDGTVDIAPVPSAQYVRLTDVTPQASFPTPTYNDADGYDVDAVKALCGTQDSGPGPIGN